MFTPLTEVCDTGWDGYGVISRNSCPVQCANAAVSSLRPSVYDGELTARLNT